MGDAMSRRLRGALVGVVLLAGCNRGPEMGHVHGRVTFRETPVTHGVVLFLPEKGPAAVGKLDPQGQFEMRTNGELGVFVGTAQVAICPPTDLAVIGMPQYPGAPPNVRFDDIPPQYHQANTSPLRVDVQPGDNRCDFELGTSAERPR